MGCCKTLSQNFLGWDSFALYVCKAKAQMFAGDCRLTQAKNQFLFFPKAMTQSPPPPPYVRLCAPSPLPSQTHTQTHTHRVPLWLLQTCTPSPHPLDQWLPLSHYAFMSTFKQQNLCINTTWMQMFVLHMCRWSTAFTSWIYRLWRARKSTR